MMPANPIQVREATADAWSDVEQLFGRGGASNGCWCQYWLLGADYTRRARAENKKDLRTQVHRGGAGLVAYSDDEPVGWARFSPRSELHWLLHRFARYEFTADDAWAMSCFFVTRNFRGQGVMVQLIEFATRWGHEHGIVIEAYPIDTAIGGATRNTFPGVLQTFLDAGYTEQGRLAKDRVVVVAEPSRA